MQIEMSSTLAEHNQEQGASTNQPPQVLVGRPHHRSG
jgi:hypothetical protein